MVAKTLKTLTYGQLTSSNRQVEPRVKSAMVGNGTPREYIEKAIAVGKEIQRHFPTEESFTTLGREAILPSDIAEKFYDLQEYHNQLYPEDPISV